MLNEIGKIYTRPWGSYETLVMAKNYQVKRIIVSPQGRLSLQKHAKRAEHWVVVQGKPTVTVEKEVKLLSANQSVFIPLGAIHRLENFTNELATIIEVQIGEYLGEDDIIRLEDIYSR